MPSPKRRTLERLARKAASPAGPPGYGGGGWNGGSTFVDAFRSRRAPSPAEMVEAFKGVVYSCSSLNQGGVARTRLGLYATTGQGQLRPKCLVRPLGRSAKSMLGGRVLTKSAAWFRKNAAASDVDEVAEHPLLEMLAAVNDDWDYDSWVRYTVACLDVVGWFFHLPEASSSVRGKPVPDTLWPLLPQYVLPVRSPSGSLTEKYTYFDQSYSPHELIRGRFVSLRDPYGLGYGPTQAGFAYAGLSDQYASIQEDLLTQGGKISGYLTDADPAMGMGAAEGKRYETEINSTWTRGNAGRIKYIPANLKFTAAQWAPTDLAALEVSDKALQLFANCFGVPLSLLKTEDVNLANAEAGHRQHAELAVDPRCTLIASSLTKWARRYGREHGVPGWDRLFFAFDNPVQEDRERNARIFQVEIDSGQKTPNEVRAEKGEEPYDGGDVVLRPGTLKTIDGIVNPPEPPPAAPNPGHPPPPAAKSLDLAKFTPNRDGKGRFASASGAGAGSAPVPANVFPGHPAGAENVRAAAQAAAGPSVTVHAAAGPPLSPSDAKAAAGAARKDAAAVRVTERPQVEAFRDHGITSYKVGGRQAAVVQSDEWGVRWSVHEHDLAGKPAATLGGDTSGYTHTYLSREKAEANAEKHARNVQRATTGHTWYASKDPAATAARHVESTPDKHDVFVYVVDRPGRGKAFGEGERDRRPFAGTSDPGLSKDMVDRGDGGAVPPDGGDDFGLPEGRPIAREFRKWVARVAREVLGTTPDVGAPLPPGWPELADYEDPMAAAMTPILASYWDQAGKATRERLGLDPAEWRVVDPNLHEMIVSQAHDFCASTLATTALSARDAYSAVRGQLLSGVLGGGEAVPELRKRLQAVFAGMSKAKADQVARSESSRAVHKASEQSAKDSGVVAGKVWLLSSNSCDFCHELARRSAADPVPLGGEFAVSGTNPTYSSIRTPPAHPSCRCSTTYRLTPEYQALVDADPPETYQPGPLGPER